MMQSIFNHYYCFNHMKVCPKCGRTSDKIKFIGSLCIKCYNPDVKVPTIIKVTIGKQTNKILFKNKWIPNTENNLNKLISSHIKADFEDIKYNKANETLTIYIKVEGEIIPVNKHVTLRFRKILEPHIAKIRGGYYEGIIQVRGKKAKLKWWAGKIATHLKRHGISITKQEKLKEGIDLYISDKKKIPKLMHKLNLKFLRTKTLYGLKQGRRVYRDTFLIRIQ